MSKIKFELNREGVRALMRSAEMMEICQNAADQALQILGLGYTSDARTGKNRVNVAVSAETPKAYNSNLKHNAILKAVGSVKLS